MTEHTPRHSSRSRRPSISARLPMPHVQSFAAIALLATLVAFWALFLLSEDSPATATDAGDASVAPAENLDIDEVTNPTVTVAPPCGAGAYTTDAVSYDSASVIGR